MLLSRWVFKVLLKAIMLGFDLKSGRLFQALGREKSVNFFTCSVRASGTYSSLLLRKLQFSFLWLFRIQAFWRDGGQCL